MYPKAWVKRKLLLLYWAAYFTKMPPDLSTAFVLLLLACPLFVIETNSLNLNVLQDLQTFTQTLYLSFYLQLPSMHSTHLLYFLQLPFKPGPEMIIKRH